MALHCSLSRYREKHGLVGDDNWGSLCSRSCPWSWLCRNGRPAKQLLLLLLQCTDLTRELGLLPTELLGELLVVLLLLLLLLLEGVKLGLGHSRRRSSGGI
eukprot:gnl/Trimastix_PCT/1213.p3 GENE.gnl/Trimastix_PCT/1213~~gnl/Trimastix_PCT/1213.p3  ORF type:complete len:101 (+),score=1.14 gnl/Trimastix_PCT/1213:379-681(+)